MMLSRREAMKALAFGAGAGVLGETMLSLGGRSSVWAQGGRVLDIPVVGFTLGIHVPSMAAMKEILPTLPGYAAAKTTRFASQRVITQTIVSGSGDIGAGDPIITMRAAEAGADVKIIGLVFNSTSLVFVVNGNKVKQLQDLQKPDTVVAVNSKGDFTHVLLVGPLLKRGVDLSKVTVVEIGGSGGRTKALLAGRVDAVPVHFDQAFDIAKQGNYPVLLDPAKEYKAWFGEVYFATTEWLKKPENKRAAVDLLKANLLAFRRASKDFAWFADEYRKYSTNEGAAKAPDDTIKPVWEILVKQVDAFPGAMESFTVQNFKDLVPVYKAAEALEGKVDVAKIVDRTYLDQALKELN
ncbi:MAG: ABC transporter substrate-binding protein [candidate division NC10 bacterium]|nr:ABC transporter substrate-binding protein [candidate division NC10 bacterium]